MFIKLATKEQCLAVADIIFPERSNQTDELKLRCLDDEVFGQWFEAQEAPYGYETLDGWSVPPMFVKYAVTDPMIVQLDKEGKYESICKSST